MRELRCSSSSFFLLYIREDYTWAHDYSVTIFGNSYIRLQQLIQLLTLLCYEGLLPRDADSLPCLFR